MKPVLSTRAKSLSSSATFAMLQKSMELKQAGIDVISMSVGEPDFATPDYIKEAAHKAINDNWTKYSPVPGYMPLREACARKLKDENGLDYTAKQILISNGAKQSLCNAIMAVVDNGDEVVIPTPCWVSYMQMVILAGGIPVTVAAGIDQDFKVTAAQLEAAITPRTRAIMLCSPSNPTGAIYSRDELASLAEVIARHDDIVVISDEIYEHLNYIGGHESIAQFDSIRDRVVIINGVSKAYAMTGWRIGFAAGPQWLIDAANKIQGQYTSGPCSVSQKAAEAAYCGPQDDVETMRLAFDSRRKLLISLAREVPGFEVNEPEGAFYLFPKCSALFGKSYKSGDEVRTINSGDDFAMFLLEKAHVATVGGDSFGAPEYFRMSYATDEASISEAVKRIKEAVATLE
ncbi:MAG: pyridoxal phosphate-dependent aminotransferase [Bacteroidales bacterium]|nr:pyridoxal phosphate-dependent aminotransferase [Bacteroidales bacterium]